jgi:hypothetical protein
VEGTSHDLLLDLDADPLEKAVEVDSPAGAGALARSEEEIFFGPGVFQADLAGDIFVALRVRFRCLPVFEDCAVEAQLVLGRSGGHLNFAVDEDLADEELDPAEFKGLSCV